MHGSNGTFLGHLFPVSLPSSWSISAFKNWTVEKPGNEATGISFGIYISMRASPQGILIQYYIYDSEHINTTIQSYPSSKMKNMEEQIRVTPCLVCILYFIKHLFGSETRTHVDVGLITKLS